MSQEKNDEIVHIALSFSERLASWELRIIGALFQIWSMKVEEEVGREEFSVIGLKARSAKAIKERGDWNPRIEKRVVVPRPLSWSSSLAWHALLVDFWPVRRTCFYPHINWERDGEWEWTRLFRYMSEFRTSANARTRLSQPQTFLIVSKWKTVGNGNLFSSSEVGKSHVAGTGNRKKFRGCSGASFRR